MRSARNNLLAGMLVLLAIVTAVVVVVLLGGGLERLGKRDYLVRFTLDEGVMGVEPGSKVTIGGRQVGVVKSLSFETDDQDTTKSVLIVISIEKELALREGAVAMLLSPLLGGSATINFPTVGSGPELAAGVAIDGMISPPAMLAQAGYGPEQARQLQSILKRADDLTAKVDLAVDDAKAVIADARQRSTGWFDRVDSITRNVDETAARGPAIAQDLQARLDQLKEMFTTAKEVLDENRPNIKDTLANARSVSEKADAFMTRLNGELVDATKALLEDGQAAMASGRSALDKADQLLAEQSPNLRRTMANLRLSSDQLAATLAEVRRSPWRLLYRPDKRELEFELLYDSARSYAAAVSDLRAASETMQSLSSGPNPADSAALAELARQIEGSFQKYQDAEKEFLRQIMEHSK